MEPSLGVDPAHCQVLKFDPKWVCDCAIAQIHISLILEKISWLLYQAQKVLMTKSSLLLVDNFGIH